MNSDDIISIWETHMDMNLCEYCTKPRCFRGGWGCDFKWNGAIPKIEPPPHIRCKQDQVELCGQVDELHQEVFGDLDELFKTVPKLNRFEKDML